MGGALDNAALFLVQTLFDLYLYILLLRIVLQFVGANFYNPICQFITKVTDPIVLPLRRVLPRIRWIDISSVTLLIAIAIIKYTLIIVLFKSSTPSIFALFILAITDTLTKLINVFFYSIIIMIVISWVSPSTHSPITDILYKLSEPLMKPARRFIPPIAGFDISPIPVLIGLKLIAILFVQPLLALAFG